MKKISLIFVSLLIAISAKADGLEKYYPAPHIASISQKLELITNSLGPYGNALSSIEEEHESVLNVLDRKRVKKISTYKDGEIRNEFFFDSKGLIIKSVSHYDSGSHSEVRYAYNKFGNLISEESRYKDKKQPKATVKKTTYAYKINPDGNIERSQTIGGELKGVVTYRTDGNILEISSRKKYRNEYDPLDDLKIVAKMSYVDNILATAWLHESNVGFDGCAPSCESSSGFEMHFSRFGEAFQVEYGRPDKVQKFYYSDGLISAISGYNPYSGKNRPGMTISYNFDSNGNWISWGFDGRNELVEVRKIEYR